MNSYILSSLERETNSFLLLSIPILGVGQMDRTWGISTFQLSNSLPTCADTTKPQFIEVSDGPDTKAMGASPRSRRP